VRTSRGGRPPGLPEGSDGAVLRHELGHALGLDHVDDPRELLFAGVALAPHAGYGPGDRRGLWELGAGQGCG
jgi:predicted Zn-dependent protease